MAEQERRCFRNWRLTAWLSVLLTVAGGRGATAQVAGAARGDCRG